MCIHIFVTSMARSLWQHSTPRISGGVVGFIHDQWVRGYVGDWLVVSANGDVVAQGACGRAASWSREGGKNGLGLGVEWVGLVLQCAISGRLVSVIALARDDSCGSSMV
jgi:hypothetical protein